MLITFYANIQNLHNTYFYVFLLHNIADKKKMYE